MDVTRPVPSDVSDHLGMLRRHWLAVILLTLIGLGLALAVTQQQTKVYESATSVLVQPAGQDTNVVGGRTRGDINLDTEAQLVRSTAVAAGAAQLLVTGVPPDELASRVSVKVPPNAAILVITFAAESPEAAQQGSHAFAEAYLRNRQDSAKADMDVQIVALNAKIAQLEQTLNDTNRRLADARRDTSEWAVLDSQRLTALEQINSLTNKLNQLTTATVSAGKIISAAPLPSGPVKPNILVNLATGTMAGLLAGCCLAAARERYDQRIRQAAEVARRTGVPVLAELPGGRDWVHQLRLAGGRRPAAGRLVAVFGPHGVGGRTFTRLRNEVLASLGPDDQVLVVTGASLGAAATVVAANLAAALARTGSEVILVGAHLPDRGTGAVGPAGLLGVLPAPGLSEVLTGRVGVGDAVQRAAREPWLRVLTTGGSATAAGLARKQALRDILDKLRGQAEYIVIEAPSTAGGADAQSMASLADAAIIAVELHHTQRPEVLDAAEQLRRVGVTLLGAVVLPRLHPDPGAGREPDDDPDDRLCPADPDDDEETLPPGPPAAHHRRPSPVRPAGSRLSGSNGARAVPADDPTIVLGRLDGIG